MSHKDFYMSRNINNRFCFIPEKVKNANEQINQTCVSTEAFETKVVQIFHPEKPDLEITMIGKISRACNNALKYVFRYFQTQFPSKNERRGNGLVMLYIGSLRFTQK